MERKIYLNHHKRNGVHSIKSRFSSDLNQINIQLVTGIKTWPLTKIGLVFFNFRLIGFYKHISLMQSDYQILQRNSVRSCGKEFLVISNKENCSFLWYRKFALPLNHNFQPLEETLEIYGGKFYSIGDSKHYLHFSWNGFPIS